MSRIKELDLTKSFIIFFSLIGIHTLYHLADYEALLETTTGTLLNILSTAWDAPVFMFCMGMTLSFSRHQAPTDWLRRGIHLITVGMVLNILRYGPFIYTAYASGNPEYIKELAQIFNVDILQFAGLAFMLMALLKYLKMSDWSILTLSVLMNVAGTFLIGHNTSSYVLNQVLGYFYHTPTCSCFPLLDWFIFVAAGNVMAKIYRESEHISTAYRIIIPVCSIIALVYQYFAITQQLPFFKVMENDWSYYNMATFDALCIAFGVAPFMVGIFQLIGKLIPDRWMGVLSYPSRHINQFYCVSWVWIMWIHCFLYRIEPATTLSGFVLVWILIAVLTTLAVLIYNRFWAQTVSPWFSRHQTAWTIGVWAVCLLFGIWYFTTIPEPYVMPY